MNNGNAAAGDKCASAVRGAFAPGRYAAIDIGTVTCRLLVADVDESGALHEVERGIAICNLGVGVDETGLLAPESIERVGVVVDGFMDTLHACEAQSGAEIPVCAMATSASRDAKNADDFKQRLARAGLKLQVIPGKREAALSFCGASSAFPGEKVVVVDVGGGSTEIIAGRSGDGPAHVRSFDVGCRRITERFFRHDPPASGGLAGARAWVRGMFADYLSQLKGEGWFDDRIVAVAGTATSVVSMREKMAVYESALVHGARVSRQDVGGLLDELGRMTCAQRQQVVGLDPARAPVIVAGLLVLDVLLDEAEADGFTVSEFDILHGIILASARGEGASGDSL